MCARRPILPAECNVIPIAELVRKTKQMLDQILMEANVDAPLL